MTAAALAINLTSLTFIEYSIPWQRSTHLPFENFPNLMCFLVFGSRYFFKIISIICLVIINKEVCVYDFGEGGRDLNCGDFFLKDELEVCPIEKFHFLFFPRSVHSLLPAKMAQ